MIFYLLFFTFLSSIECFLNDLTFRSIGFWDLGENLTDLSPIQNDASIVELIRYNDTYQIKGIFNDTNGAIDFGTKEVIIEIPGHNSYSNNKDLSIS